MSSINHDFEYSLSGQKPHIGTNGWFATTSLIIGTMAGAGILGIPLAVNQTGWAGLLFLCICATTCIYTGILMGRTMLRVPNLSDYAEIGAAAFGTWGKVASHALIYTTLVGVSIIFFVLLGLLLNALVEEVGRGFWTLAAGIVLLPIAIALKTMSEVKWTSYLATLATTIVALVAIVLSIQFYYSPQRAQLNTKHETIVASTFVTGFSVFSFAFGSHAVFPNLYAQMADKRDWDKSLITAYTYTFVMYFPTGFCGYLAYGKILGGPQISNILDAIRFHVSSRAANIAIKACSVLIIIHLLCALPIVVNPVFLLAERKLNAHEHLFKRIIVRTLIFAILIVIGLAFPYFLDIMSLVTDISVTGSAYVLPCLFYWKLFSPAIGEKIFLIFVVLFGIVGSILGIYVAVKGLIEDIKHNPNPFQGIFSFGHHHK
eukprot:TRINITY_DN14797_c0_g1_i1.p1 TRINITY_DN14797_c0_g1~~TRINITY_DN14797_c0_g1_i1.p1  ORF type:complete len:431 (-),score=44.33 TRINITY_DN14797_c0_g1_i1:17-1309(-)